MPAQFLVVDPDGFPVTFTGERHQSYVLYFETLKKARQWLHYESVPANRFTVIKVSGEELVEVLFEASKNGSARYVALGESYNPDSTGEVPIQASAAFLKSMATARRRSV